MIDAGLTVLVRPRQRSDECFIVDLGGIAFREYGSRARDNVQNMLREPGFTRIALGRDGRPAGFAIVTHERGSPRASLNAIAVTPEERGQGVGSALMRAILEEALRRGARSLRLVTADSNLSALDLFMKHGFTLERRVARYYARGQDGVVLQKRL